MTIPSEEEIESLVIELRTAFADTNTHELLIRGGDEGLTDLNLRRWLAARKWDVALARESLLSHAQFRSSFVPQGRILEVSC